MKKVTVPVKNASLLCNIQCNIQIYNKTIVKI